ncbi:MAG: glycosyltransferase family 4 protein [Lentisphaeria bacterium]|jgi:glycosyltransferase involved in cell wall biosynthesis|nr:glycosyltransferase family 4 protein [Lentisphaeria bacterium]MDP7741626.1 glycosyltransferase family 4 protein [Lentisphaeria bacterium]
MKNAGQPGEICILHLITRLIRGGAQLNTLYTAAHTAIGGCQARSVVATGPDVDDAGDLFDDARALGIEPVIVSHLVRRGSVWHDPLALLQLCRLIRRLRPTIVHTHTSKAGFLGRVAARLMRVPVVIHTPHGAIHHGYFPSARKTGIYVRLERLVARRCDVAICLTEGEKRDWETVNVRHRRVEVIPSGVDIAKFEKPSRPLPEIRRELGLAEDDRIIGYVGRLVELKGIGYMIRAMPAILAQVPQARLLIVGDGEFRPQLESLARELGVDERTCFVGTRTDVPDMLAAMDVAVLPTICAEAMGRVLVEAAAAGKPVVATRLGGVGDVVRHDETGLIVAPEDADALAVATITILTDAELATRLGETARKQAGKFSLDEMMRQLNRLYASFLPPPGGC